MVDFNPDCSKKIISHNQLVQLCARNSEEDASKKCVDAVETLACATPNRAHRSLKWVYSHTKSEDVHDAMSGVVRYFANKANDDKALRPIVRSMLTYMVQHSCYDYATYDAFDSIQYALGYKLVDSLVREFKKGTWSAGRILLGRATQKDLRRHALIFKRMMNRTDGYYAGDYLVYVRAAWLYWRTVSNTSEERVDMVIDALENAEDDVLRCGAAWELEDFVGEPQFAKRVRAALSKAATNDGDWSVRKVATDVLKENYTACWM